MDMEPPILDWDLADRLAGNKREVAIELFGLLRQSLPTEMQNIRMTYLEHQYPELLKHVHKLHGATSYCGVPRLKLALSHLETALKNNRFDDLAELYLNVEKAARDVLNELDANS